MNNAVAIKNYPVAAPGWRDKEFYLWSAVFVLGNLALPQLCHLAALGGKVWLPIYFCTFLAAVLYGRNVAVLTAVLSPVLNYALFAMPAAGMLPVMMVKSLLIALLAPALVKRFSLPVALGLTIVGYQLGGAIFAGLTGGEMFADARLGWPGMIAQFAGVWLVLRLWRRAE